MTEENPAEAPIKETASGYRSLINKMAISLKSK